jgi:hypothetical protein
MATKSVPQARKAKRTAKARETLEKQQNGPAITRLAPKKRKAKGNAIADSVKPKRSEIPWGDIKNDYRIGMSTRAISHKYKNIVTAQGIGKRARSEGWTQDLMREVQERAATKLVSTQVSIETGKVSTPHADAEQAVEAAAEQSVAIIVTHRRDILAGRQLANLLATQLQTAAQTRDELEDTIHDATMLDANAQRRNAMLRAVGLPQHAATMRDLTTAMKNLIALEREAWNLNGVATGETIEDRLKRLEHDHG